MDGRPSIDRSNEPRATWRLLDEHFAAGTTLDIVTSRRQFPDHLRADLQAAITEQLAPYAPVLFGLHQQHTYFPLGFAGLLLRQKDQEAMVAPLQYQDIDVGAETPVACLTAGLYLAKVETGTRTTALALLVSQQTDGRAKLANVELAYPPSPEAAALATGIVKGLEAALRASRSYRGKTLSFEAQSAHLGQPAGLLVHRVTHVPRETVILDPATMARIDQNVFEFDRHREGLKALGQSTRKGILLYGPPGTGKTHAIRYISTNLPERTTVLVTADQVSNLARYMDLARTLQPSIVVIEDVDLIARSREGMEHPGVESLLNMLLNEMDGLRDDADILFILTTNRPDQIEAALASRPGRIDQAIEIPLPDADCRKRLVELYGRLLAFEEAALATAVERTAGVSAAFMKEMVRRLAQRSLGAEAGAGTIGPDDAKAVLDDMLANGGLLGRRLLGAA